jgi:hypothetical protein
VAYENNRNLCSSSQIHCPQHSVFVSRPVLPQSPHLGRAPAERELDDRGFRGVVLAFAAMASI